MRPVQLQIMPDDGATVRDGWIVHRQRDFRGGETQALLPEAVGRNQLLRMENVLLYSTGYLSAFFELDVPIISGAHPGVCLDFAFGGTYNAYYAPGDGYLYSSTVNTVLATPQDVSAGTADAVADAYISGVIKPVTFLGKKYCINPNPDNTKNGILNLTDKAVITLTGKTACKLAVYANRLWVLNTDGTIQISDNGDASTFDPLNILWLPNQEPALDFVPVQGGAIVYGVNSLYAMYGSSYQDITFVPLMLGKKFTSGSAEVGGLVYILSTEGIYKTTLNGAELLPHNQQDFLQSIFGTLTNYSANITAISLQKFQAILYIWPVSSGGSQSLLYYHHINGYSKANLLLPAECPHALELNDINTDFIMGSSTGILVKSLYPSNDLQRPLLAVIQTRHEDADSTRQKTWREFGIQVHYTVFGVTIEAFLDYRAVPIVIASNIILQAGDNIFNMDNAEGLDAGVNFPRSTSISIRLTFNNNETVTTLLSSETSGKTLTSETSGDSLVFDTMPGNFMIQELRLKYCLAGPDI